MKTIKITQYKLHFLNDIDQVGIVPTYIVAIVPT